MLSVFHNHVTCQQNIMLCKPMHIMSYFGSLVFRMYMIGGLYVSLCISFEVNIGWMCHPMRKKNISWGLNLTCKSSLQKKRLWIPVSCVTCLVFPMREKFVISPSFPGISCTIPLAAVTVHKQTQKGYKKDKKVVSVKWWLIIEKEK